MQADEASILDVFPPGRRRAIVMLIAGHPEFDDRAWQGTLHFRLFRRHDGTCGVGHWYETREDEIGGVIGARA